MFTAKKLTKIFLTFSLGATLGIISGVTKSTLAQSADALQSNNNYQSNEQNSMSVNGFNPLQLMHNANLFNGRNMQQFNADSAQNLSNAADEYKRKLQQLWREKHPSSQLQTQPQVTTNLNSPK